MSINRKRIGRAFDQQAGEYDRHTSVQKRVVNRLVTLVKNHVEITPAEVLDIGCGTGRLLSSLNGQYPQARLYGLDLAYNMVCHAREHLSSGALLVNGDAEQLPFKNGAFGLVVSSSTLQWLENLDVFFRQCHRVMKDDGLLCIAFFGGQSLHELQECYSDAAQLRSSSSGAYEGRLHRFMELADVRKVLERIDFKSVLIMSEFETDYYPGVPELLRSIKRIGAGSSAQESMPGGLGWRGILNETSRLYHQRYGTDGMIPVTYEVFYIIAKSRTTI
ncbi:MAG: methyltransferase domain-containing protein [Desulfuromonadales bacterium]|nr:methyltransferase domain-containing protein [Desulfuromonadales bacterium]